MKSAPAQIVREYGPFPGVTDVHGVSHDGRRVWFATGDSLQSMDPASGKIVSIIKMTARAGTAYDGRHLYQLAGPSIQKVDPRSGEILATLPAPAEGCSGMAWAEGALWVAHYRERKIHKIDPATGKILRTIALGPLRDRRHVDQRRPVARHLGKRRKRTAPRLARDRRVQESLLMPPGVYVSGLEAGDGVFYCGGSTSGRIRAVRQPGARVRKPLNGRRRPNPAAALPVGATAVRLVEPAPAGAPSPGESSVFPAPSARRRPGSAFRQRKQSSHGSGGMVQAPRRTGFSGPTLVRLLARLTTDVDVPESGQSLSDQLSLWLKLDERHRPPRPAQPRSMRRAIRSNPAGDGGRHHAKRSLSVRERALMTTYSDAARRAFRAAAQGRAIGAGRSRGGGNAAAGKPAPGWTRFARTCAACCWPNWIFVFNRWKGCSRRFAPAN